jgi:hypothetical protein
MHLPLGHNETRIFGSGSIWFLSGTGIAKGKGLPFRRSFSHVQPLLDLLLFPTELLPNEIPWKENYGQKKATMFGMPAEKGMLVFMRAIRLSLIQDWPDLFLDIEGEAAKTAELSALIEAYDDQHPEEAGTLLPTSRIHQRTKEVHRRKVRP